MAEQKFNLVIAILLGLLVLGVFALNFKDYSNDIGEKNKVSVNGDAELKFGPEQAEIFVRTETKAENAKEAQRQNSENMNKVKNALLELGVNEKDIETVEFNLYALREYNPNTQQVEDKGFLQKHTFKITTKNIEKVGEIINIAVENGANSVDNIVFSLSKEGLKEAKDKVIQNAVENARDKAEAMAEGAGSRLGDVISITENSFNFIPYYSRDAAEIKETAIPPIQPSEVSVSASVQVVFELK